MKKEKAFLRRVLIFVVLFSFLLTPALFASGKKKAAVEEKVNITMWTLFGGGEGYIMTNLINSFNSEHANIEVKEQLIEWGEYYNKFLTGLLSGEPPDIGIMHLAVLPDYASRGVLSRVEEQVPQAFKDQFLDNIIEKAYYEGHLYAIPIDTHPVVLYYNKKVLKEAGLVDSGGNVLIPKTWQELYEYAKKIKSATGKWGLTLETGAMLGERLWIGIYSQFGATFQDPATNKLKLDIDKAARTYEMIARFYREKLAIGPADYAECESLFMGDGTGYHINGVWAMSVYPKTDDLEFGVTSFPAIPGSKPYTWGDSHSFVFPKKDDKRKLEAALTFAQWFSEHTLDWATAGHLPVNEKVLNSPELLQLPMRKDYLDVGPNAVLAPSVKGWSELREEMWEIGGRVVLQELTPMEAAKALRKKIDEITK